ncbi:chitin synthase III catalytic subunit-domain-containing protein [Syncephalis fuscata]|nr:chitin synthase III catalytic subunit-domain-containing protein [Syncephalis fuscata]
MKVEFGKFGFCETASYPICLLFSGVVPKCSVQVDGAKFPKSADLANFVASILLAVLALYLMFRSYRKYAAVGRKEMYIMFGFLFFSSLLQTIYTTGVAGRAKNGKVVVAIQAGLSVATFWTLLLNGLVGFQLAEDGTLLSTLSVFGSGGIVAIITAIFSADAGLDIGLLGTSPLAADPDSPAVWILYFLIPAAFTLLLAVVAIALAQVFYIVASNPICAGTNSKIDGSFAGTILTGVAVVFLFRYWDSITEDEWDEFGTV